MTEMFSAADGEPIPVIVRAVTVSYDQPPERQRKAHYAVSEDRRRAIELAVAPRMQRWALERLLRELVALPAVADAGDAIVRRHYGRHGYLEVTIVEAHGPLTSRYLAVSRLPDGERELYLDALIDDALADRDHVKTVTIADPDTAPIHAGGPTPVAARTQPAPAAQAVI